VPPGGGAKLADFGIASLEDTQRTLTGAAFGSLPYVAPEQAAGRRGGPPADLWALGATLWFAAEGSPPFQRDGAAATLAAVLHEPPGRPRRAGPLTPVLLALLDKDPDRRPAGATLRRLLEPLAVPGPAATSPPAPTAPLPAAPTEPLAGPAPTEPLATRDAAEAATEPLAGRAPTGPLAAPAPGWGRVGAVPTPGWGEAAGAPAPGWGRAGGDAQAGGWGRAGGGVGAPAVGRRRGRRGRRLLGAAAVLVALLALGSLLDGRERPAGREGGGGRERAAAAGVGRPARDGQFEFVVRSVRCGLRRLGPELARQTPQGRFCLVALRVANVGAEARDFAAGHQRLLGPDGSRHAVDGAATAANGSPRLLYSPVNPGNRIEGTLVFDVPAGMRPARIELHDSPFSRGVTVTLR
jgi:Domain of unknown function (DUF4352)/Protein kinase domain